MALHWPEGMAEATVRAGFILIPEKGASKAMKRVSRSAAQAGIHGRSRADAETVRAVAIKSAEMKSSPQKAAWAPGVPGTVTAKLTAE